MVIMGKHKYIETPEKMWELFEAYKEAVKLNPFLVQDYVGKDGEMVYRERERPLTFEGFYDYCYENIGCIDQYFENRDGRYTDYVAICSRIKKIIRKDQIEGGMASIYNASITQRLNGLADKKELDVKGEPRIFNL
jgi:hypothetical protein